MSIGRVETPEQKAIRLINLARKLSTPEAQSPNYVENPMAFKTIPVESARGGKELDMEFYGSEGSMKQINPELLKNARLADIMNYAEQNFPDLFEKNIVGSLDVLLVPVEGRSYNSREDNVMVLYGDSGYDRAILRHEFTHAFFDKLFGRKPNSGIMVEYMTTFFDVFFDPNSSISRILEEYKELGIQNVYSESRDFAIAIFLYEEKQGQDGLKKVLQVFECASRENLYNGETGKQVIRRGETIVDTSELVSVLLRSLGIPFNHEFHEIYSNVLESSKIPAEFLNIVKTKYRIA